MINKLTVKTKKRRAYIKSLLALHEIKIIDLSKEIGVTPEAVTMTISGATSSRRIKDTIARRLNKPFEKLWGEPEKKAA